MQGIRLPRNMRIKKNEDGTFNIFTIKAKLTTPLKSFEKRNILTPAMVSYLEDYKSRLNKDKEGKITDLKTLGRIDAILSKPRYDKDPMQLDTKVECRYTEAHYRRAGYKGYEDFKEKEAIRIAEQEKLRKETEEKRAKEVKKDAKAKQ
jgi:hypothetical protein